MEDGLCGLPGVHAQKLVMEEKERDTDHVQIHILLGLAGSV